MSYDLYLYKSSLGKPDIDEASKVIEDDGDIWVKKSYNYENKTAIEKSLMNVDRTLEAFNYEQLAQKQGKTIDEVRGNFLKFELNSANPDIQVEIYDYHVAISVPYVHRGESAKKAFEKLTLYVDTINKVAGYFLYDPQTAEVYDPATQKLAGLSKYLSVSNDFDSIVNSVKPGQNKKPWWKIW